MAASQTKPEHIMNIAKNMEFIFVAAVVVAVGLSNAIAAPAAPLQVAVRTAVVKAPVAPIARIVVIGKRPVGQKGKHRA